MNLKERWLNLPCNRKDPQGARRKLEILEAFYECPSRGYHTLLHIEECLEELDSCRHLVMNPEAMELAIWYHDVIYDTAPLVPGLNESSSYGIAFDHYSNNGLTSDFLFRVGRYILATRHNVAPREPDERIIADIDVAIFARSEARVDEYEKGIWKEYDHVRHVPEARRTRATILQGFLDRGVYWTPFFRQRYRKKAESSLRRLIAKNS